MATAATRVGDFTYEDFCALVGDDQKADLIDGVIYMASPENIDANELFVWLITLLHLFVRKRDLGRIHGSRVACRLDDKNAPEPDILFLGKKHLDRLRRGGIRGPADLAMEIVSPESVERDYYKKRRQYERFRIREYWIIDPQEQTVLVLHLDRRGKYREIRPGKGRLHSQVLTGFWLDPTWLWQRPLPDEIETLELIVSRRP